MKLYYTTSCFNERCGLYVFDQDKKPLWSIMCKKGDNLLFVLTDYLEENNISIQFEELIPL